MELDKIIEYIVQEVVKKINSQNIIEEFSPKEKILVAITGSTNNLEQIVLELRKISKNYDFFKIIFKQIFNFNFKDIDKTYLSFCYHS